MTKTTTYTSSDDSYKEESSYEPKIFHNDGTLINVYNPYDKRKLLIHQRLLENAYVDDIDIQELSDYIALIENNIIKLKSQVLKNFFIENKDEITEKEIIITKRDVDYDDYIMTDDESLQRLLYTLLESYVLLYEVGSICVFIKSREYSFNYGSIQSIFKLIHELKNSDLCNAKETIKELKSKIELTKQELNELLNENKVLAKEYQEYMSLYNNEENKGMVRKLGN